MSLSRRGRPCLLAAMVALAAATSGCSHVRHGGGGDPPPAAVPPGDPVALNNGRLAMLTPTAAPGHEEDRQAIAQIFSDTLAKSRPDLTLMPLPATLSAINGAGLAATYNRMYVAYKDTGLFDRQDLHQIGDAIGARYLVELKLGAYDHGTNNGVSFMGLSPFRRTTADLRLSVEIWDARDGRLVWQHATEDSETTHSIIFARTVKMDDVAKTAAEDLVKQLPR